MGFSAERREEEVVVFEVGMSNQADESLGELVLVSWFVVCCAVSLFSLSTFFYVIFLLRGPFLDWRSSCGCVLGGARIMVRFGGGFVLRGSRD